MLKKFILGTVLIGVFLFSISYASAEEIAVCFPKGGPMVGAYAIPDSIMSCKGADKKEFQGTLSELYKKGWRIIQ